MDGAWGGNPFAGGASFCGQGAQESDPFAEESCDQVVYETDNKANLLSIYNRALQNNASYSRQELTPSSKDRRSETTQRAQQAWRPSVPVTDGPPSNDAQDAAGFALRSSQWTSLGTNPARQSRRPSLDPVGSFDSPVGWDEGPQEEFEDLVRKPTSIPEVPEPTFQEDRLLQRDRHLPEAPRVPPFPRQEQPGPVTERVSLPAEQPGPAEKRRSLLDLARDVWARPPSQFDQGARDTRKRTEDPFPEAGSLGLGWSQPTDKPARGKGRKAAERPKFSIRPQHRPSLTQAKGNVGLGLAPMAQRLKQLAESSVDDLDKTKVGTAHVTARDEETEQDDIEEQEYHFEGNEAATNQGAAVATFQAVDAAADAEDIDEDEEDPRSPVRQLEHYTPLDRHPPAAAATTTTGVRTPFMPDPTPADTSGRNLTSQFRNALLAATAEQPEAIANETDWDKRQPAGLLAQLQRARQRQQNQEMAFAKALQMGQPLDHDVRECLDVRILETSLEAHLLKCRCEVLHEPEDPLVDGGPADARVYVLVNRKTQIGELFEPGKVVRIHPPWQTLRDNNQNRIVFNATCCQR